MYLLYHIFLIFASVFSKNIYFFQVFLLSLNIKKRVFELF
nr:MAG TPA: hypothetical protein [Caudoviricetes sp.]